MRNTIYTVGVDGKSLTAMRPAAPRNEDFMQGLVALYPELISDSDGELLLIRREQPIADQMDGSGRWSLDHLFVTRGAVPVLVEIKRAVDTRLRREVVGQMLDYAANGSAFWQAGRIAESFAQSATRDGRDPDEVLSLFLGDLPAEEFWNQVDANFSAGRVKMVFVADTIPPELARIVEFLNEQMKADVRAVELSWFESSTGVTALSPRVIGETQRAQAEKSSRGLLSHITRDEWIDNRLSPLGAEVLQSADAFISMVEGLGGLAVVTSSQGSIMSEFETPTGKFYPLRLAAERRGSVQMCFQYLQYRATFAEIDARQSIYDRLVAIVGPLSTSSLTGFPSFDIRKLLDLSTRSDLNDLLFDLLERTRT